MTDSTPAPPSPRQRQADPRIRRDLLKLSLPLAGTQLANVALAATDTAVLGHVGVAALAGGGLAVVWFNQLRTMGVGVLTPLGNRIAQIRADTRLGVGEREERIRQLSVVGFVLATIAGAIGALLLIAIGLVLPQLGQPPEVADVALPTMIALAPGLIPCLWFQALRQFTVGLEKPQALLGITVVSVLVNLVLDLALAYGWGPLPALGAVGVGLATTLVHLGTAMVFLALIHKDPELWKLAAVFPSQAKCMRPLGLDIREQLRLGLPVSATYGLEAGMFSVIAMAMGALGTSALAAHNAVYQVTFIIFQIGVGFSHGASILVSRHHGAGDNASARSAALQAAAIMAAVITLSGIAFLTIPELILRPFVADPDPQTLGLCVSLLGIGAFMQFVDIGQNLAVGILRGVGDTMTGLKASLIGYWLVGVPAAYVLGFFLHFGAVGVWWGVFLGLAFAATLLWRTFLQRVSG